MARLWRSYAAFAITFFFSFIIMARAQLGGIALPGAAPEVKFTIDYLRTKMGECQWSIDTTVMEVDPESPLVEPTCSYYNLSCSVLFTNEGVHGCTAEPGQDGVWACPKAPMYNLLGTDPRCDTTTASHGKCRLTEGEPIVMAQFHKYKACRVLQQSHFFSIGRPATRIHNHGLDFHSRVYCLHFYDR